MRHRRSGSRWPCLALAALLLGPALLWPGAADESSPEEAADPDARVAAAIAKFRGHSEKTLPSSQYEALDRSLEETRKVLYDNRAAALKAIVPLMSDEAADSFLIIELAHLVAVMESDPDRLAAAARALERADVQRHPAAAVRALAWMASRSCGPCLPAMFRVLELGTPRTIIPERGLTLYSKDRVIIFTLGQYGEAALPGLLDRLQSKDCGVRAGAARALRWVRPAAIPPALGAIALESGRFCSLARNEAWHVLGELDDPGMPGLAQRRLQASPPPDVSERQDIAGGLLASWVPAAIQVLQSMRDDPSSEVQPIVKAGLAPDREMDNLMERIGGRPGGAVRPEDRDRRLRALEDGARTGWYKMEEPLEVFVPSLTVDDIPLLDRTRAAILRQLSEDAHLHYVRLTMAVRAIRLVNARDTGQLLPLPPSPVPAAYLVAESSDGRFKLPPDLPSYFKSRYGADVRVVSTLRQTPDGPLGTISVYGNLTVGSPTGNTREERARSATLAFLKQEAALLGIRDFSEIRETRLMFDDTEPIERLRGACYVDYDRALNGIPLIWNTYSFRLGPKGDIGHFHAALVPVSSDLDAAVRQDKIPKAEARAIVERDLDALGLEKASVSADEPALAAYYRAPFVLWEIRGRYRPAHDQVAWYYGIDAITGEMVRRNCSTGRVPPMRSKGHVPGPCDAIPEIQKEPTMLPNPYYP